MKSSKTTKKYVQRTYFKIGSPSQGGHSSFKLIVRLESYNNLSEPPYYGFAGRVEYRGSVKIHKTWDEPHFFNSQNEIPFLEQYFKEKYLGKNVFKAQIVTSNYPSTGYIHSEWNGQSFVNPDTIVRTPSVKTPLSETYQFRAWLPLVNGQKKIFHQQPIFDTETGEYLEGLTLFTLMQQIKKFNTSNPNLTRDSGQIYGGQKQYHISDRNVPQFAWFDPMKLIPQYHGHGRNARPVESYSKLLAAQN